MTFASVDRGDSDHSGLALALGQVLSLAYKVMVKGGLFWFPIPGPLALLRARHFLTHRSHVQEVLDAMDWLCPGDIQQHSTSELCSKDYPGTKSYCT